jgi:hypothetical protein
MILLGFGYSIYFNVFALIISVGLSIFFLPAIILKTPSGTLALGYLLIGLLPLYLLLLWRSYYHDCLKKMRRAGHADECSQKIALRAMWHEWRYSRLEIDIDPKEVDPQGDYGTPAVGLWALALIVNTIFFVDVAYERATSFVYPLLFIFVIIASARLIARINNMTRTILVLCLLNIITTGLFFLIYNITLIAKFA